MSDLATAPTEAEERDFMTRLGEFRTTLEERDAELLDALVARATTPDGPPAGASTQATPRQQELEAFFAKLRAFKDTLSPRERRMLDGVVHGAVEEPDVEAHEWVAGTMAGTMQPAHQRIHWIRVGESSQRWAYAAACDQGTGNLPWLLDRVAIPFSASSVYTCWADDD